MFTNNNFAKKGIMEMSEQEMLFDSLAQKKTKDYVKNNIKKDLNEGKTVRFFTKKGNILEIYKDKNCINDYTIKFYDDKGLAYEYGYNNLNMVAFEILKNVTSYNQI